MEYRVTRLQLKPEFVEEYRSVHSRGGIWPSVVEALNAAGVVRMIIIQAERDVYIFEEANSLDDAQRFLDDDPETQRWEQMVNSWLTYTHVTSNPEQKMPACADVVFYLESGKLKH